MPYTYSLLSGIAVVSMSIYLFTVSHWSLKFWRLSDFCQSLRFVVKRYIILQKCPKKWIGSALLGTWWYNFQPPTPTLSTTVHSIMDRWTDRRHHANSQSYWVEYYRLKTWTTTRSGSAHENDSLLLFNFQFYCAIYFKRFYHKLFCLVCHLWRVGCGTLFHLYGWPSDINDTCHGDDGAPGSSGLMVITK